MTDAQKKVLKALKSLGAGWHTTTEVVRKLHPGKKSWRFTRQVHNVLFCLRFEKVDGKWEPKTNATNYQWRIK